MPTEAEFEHDPDAVAGRALLDAGLKALEPAERAAFLEAVRRCYASAAEDEDPPRPSA